jgi:hypothetical protein
MFLLPPGLPPLMVKAMRKTTKLAAINQAIRRTSTIRRQPTRRNLALTVGGTDRTKEGRTRRCVPSFDGDLIFAFKRQRQDEPRHRSLKKGIEK